MAFFSNVTHAPVDVSGMQERTSLLIFAKDRKNSLLASLLTVSAMKIPAAYTDRLAARKANQSLGFS